MRIYYTCEICGKQGNRCYSKDKVPAHFFCSRECQNKWQKTREDIVLRNKDPAFRKKVSDGLKRRKAILGENYHSEDTKKKIGESTINHWEHYDEQKKTKMLGVLKKNATVRRTYGPYDLAWKQLSHEMCKKGICHRCGSKDKLQVHHIIPVKNGGTRENKNLVVLCSSCHKIVEHQQKLLFDIIPDWRVIQLLVRERLHCL